MVDALRDAIGLADGWVVADLGAGTGIASGPLLDAGCVVHAIEPNDAMRAAAEARLGGRGGYHSHATRAEATGLPDAAVDLVVAAQAFHWFDVAATRTECLRILRAPRRAVVMWNRMRTEASPFLAGYELLLQRFGTDCERLRSAWGDETALVRFYGATPARLVLYHTQPAHLDALRGRLRSTSYLPAPAQPGHAQMMEEAERLFAQHARDGTVTFEYALELYIGTLNED